MACELGERWVRAPRLLVVVFCAIVCGQATFGGELRTWTDSTGKFTVQAEFVKYANGNVQLRAADGRLLNLPLERLSKDDIAYIRSYRGSHTKPRPTGEGREPSPAGPAAVKRSAEAEIDSPTSFDFARAPLKDVVAFLAEKHQLPFWIDRRALDDAGIGPDTPITARSGAGTLGDNLGVLLKPLELTWSMEDGVVVITTPEEAESHLQTRVYKVLRPVDPAGLVDDITKNISPNSWTKVGGPCSVETLSLGVVVVSQPYLGHVQLRRHYGALLKPIEVPAPKPAAPARRATPKDVLRQPTTCEFIVTPLKDAIDYFRALHKVEIVIDARALEGVGIGTDVPITFAMKGVALETELTLLLRELDLTWTVGPAVLQITTLEEAESQQQMVSYPLQGVVGPGGVDELVEAVTSTVAPACWEDVGGRGGINVGVRGTLDVRQTFQIHRQIERLLAALRLSRS